MAESSFGLVIQSSGIKTVQEDGSVWKFGYGSNMSPTFLKDKKGIKVLEFYPCVLQDWRLAFPKRGIPFVEPSFASILPSEGDVVHGVVTRICAEDSAKLDKAEGGDSFYQRRELRVCTYSGRELLGEAYTMRDDQLEQELLEEPCSLRYKNVLIQGAQECNLNELWINSLKSLPHFEGDPSAIARRQELPENLRELPFLNIAELATLVGSSQNGGKDGEEAEESQAHVSSHGIIIRLQSKTFFTVHHGRDITFRNLLHFRGKSMDVHDNGGQKPFPVMSSLELGERKYALMWLDYYLSKGTAVGLLLEFWDEQGDQELVLSRDKWLVL